MNETVKKIMIQLGIASNDWPVVEGCRVTKAHWRQTKECS
jgi:hypothetical protein